MEVVMKIDIPAAKSICEFMKRKTDTHSKSLEESILAESPGRVLTKIETEHLPQILRASLSVKTYENKDQRVRQLFFRGYQEEQCPITFRNCE